MSEPWCEQLDDYAVVAESGNRRVVMSKGLAKEFKKIEERYRAKLKAWMDIWAEDREGAISTQYFKPQESFTDDKGRRIQIWAFKSFQARLYGFSRNVSGKETFLITAVDASKKDNKADPQKLQKAQREGFKVLDTLSIR